MMLLVIDITKGFETQTAECLILGEISKKPLIVVLNKIDMIEDSKRESAIERMRKKVSKTLESTIFKNSKIIPVSALKSINIEALIDGLAHEAKSLQLHSYLRSITVSQLKVRERCSPVQSSKAQLKLTTTSRFRA
jgi:translation initiation factor 2 gamma subunit (eIF-2gamma)